MGPAQVTALLCVSLLATGRAAQASGQPAPGNLGGEPLEWPNHLSSANSDPWLAEHHDQIRVMRPRVLVLNFANGTNMDAARTLVESIIHALAESTRYHGFENPAAPAFLQYQVERYVDLRDTPSPPGRALANSSLFPTKPEPGDQALCDYAGLYNGAMAQRFGFADPAIPGRWLGLHDLIERGLINELWMIAIHDGPWPALEVAELKQHYDAENRLIPGQYGPAGNGHDATMPWSGRTFRIAFFNPHRGPGCGLENFGHGLEATANSGALPYLTPYFREFAGFDLDARYKWPFDSFYALSYDPDQVRYPAPDAIEAIFDGRSYRAAPYIAVGGNVHFPPGARHHYDTQSPVTVQSTMEGYRRREGAGARDLARPFSADKFARYDAVAPDCMGAWTIYWRQCMPGLDNPSVDDQGRPMKNWWPFLFY